MAQRTQANQASKLGLQGCPASQRIPIHEDSSHWIRICNFHGCFALNVILIFILYFTIVSPIFLANIDVYLVGAWGKTPLKNMSSSIKG